MATVSIGKQGFDLFSQDIVHADIHSTFFKQDRLLYFLADRDGVNSRKALNLARPGVGQIFSGKKLPKIDREKIMSENSHHIMLHTQNDVDGTKAMGARDTLPTLGAGVANYDGLGTAEFRRVRKATPLRVYHSDLRRARNDNTSTQARHKATLDLVRIATDIARRNHEAAWSTSLWTGGVSAVVNQDRDPWSDLLGVLAATGTDNRYGRVNRADSDKAFFRGTRITTQFAPDIFEIIDEASLGDSGTSRFGKKPDLVTCSRAKFRIFKKQVMGKSYVSLTRGLQSMAEFGVTDEILNVDGTFVTWDDHHAGDYANYVQTYCLDTWTFAVYPGENFSVTDFEDQTKIDGGGEYDKAEVITEANLWCNRPDLNATFTNVS